MYPTVQIQLPEHQKLKRARFIQLRLLKAYVARIGFAGSISLRSKPFSLF